MINLATSTQLPKIILKNKFDNHDDYRDAEPLKSVRSSDPDNEYSYEQMPSMQKYKKHTSLNKMLTNMESVVVFGSPRHDSLNKYSPKSKISEMSEISIGNHQFMIFNNKDMEKTEQFSYQEQSSVAEMPIEYSEKTGDELLDMNLNEY